MYIADFAKVLNIVNLQQEYFAHAYQITTSLLLLCIKDTADEHSV